MNDEDQKFREKIERLIPSDENRIGMIITLLGVSGTLAEFVMDNLETETLPVMIKYAVSITSANMLAMISDGKKASFTDLADENGYEMAEQTQERIYRKMKWIVETLYYELQENEKV